MFLDISLILYSIIGVVLGTAVGVIPGVGAGTTLAILFPFALFLPPMHSIVMMSAVYYGAQYGGSTTSILMKIAGEVSSIPTMLDGHKMALAGRAGSALTISAIGSFFAGIVMVLFLYYFSPSLSNFSLLFGPSEFVLLLILGLVFSVILSNSNDFIISLGLCIVGILLGLIGLDPMFGNPRYTFGIIDLHDGISIVTLSLGLYAFCEIMRTESYDHRIQKIYNILPNMVEIRSSIFPIFRGTIIGGFLGLLPGGAVLSSFAAYFVEKKINDKVGTGVIEGVASPEAANNAGVQSSFIPLLSFGIPTNSAMALILGLLMIHGYTVGPKFFDNALFTVLVFSMVFGNFVLLILNIPLIKIWVLLLKLKSVYLKGLMLLAALVGAYYSTNSIFEIYLMFFFGIFSYIISRFDIDVMPLLLGFFLGPILEENFRRSMMMFKGDITRYFDSYLFMFILISLFVYFLYKIKKKIWA